MLTTRWVRIALVGSMALAASVLAAPAAAERGEGGSNSDAGTSTQGGTITITVRGTGVRGGSPGRSVSRTVQVPAPCWMEPSMTGKKYYEYVKSGRLARDNYHHGENIEPLPGYEQYKDDDRGRWWGGVCNSGYFDGSIQEFFDMADEFFDDHPMVFIQVGEPVPVPPVPPELLRDVAAEELTLPEPELDWNPKRSGDAATLVNIDTWVWLKDRRESLYVEATANTIGGPSTARVDARLAGLTVSAPGAEPVECQGAGVPYSRGASGECSIVLRRSHPSLPVTAETQWHATWSFNGTSRGDIPEQPAGQSDTTNIRVVERQTIVR